MKKLVGIAIAVILLWIFGKAWVGFYSDWLWYESLGYEEAFWTMYSTEYIIGLIYFLVFGLVVGLNVWGASRTRDVYATGTASPFQVQLAMIGKGVKFVFFALLLFIGYVMASAPAVQWMRFLQFVHREPFGHTDPVFQKDIGFYVYELPFWQSTLSWLFAVVVISAVATLAVHVFRRSILLRPQGIDVSPATKRHLILHALFIFVLYAIDYRLKRYGLLFSEGGVAYGATYTDLHATLIGYNVLHVTAILGAFLALFGWLRRTWRWPLIGAGIQLGLAIILLMIYPAIVQQFIVKPNQLEKEKPYITENIRQTRLAYQLNQIEEKDFAYEENLTGSALANNQLTIKNVTLWDHRPVRDSYTQLQGIRTYYTFADIDIDRYLINGEYRQVMLAGRELDVSRLGGGEQWINNTFIYTHGYGIVVSPVNIVTPEGQPEFFIKNIPPEASTDLQVSRPEIYFGEMQSGDEYAIVKTTKEEFDYPLGEANRHTFYQEDAGVGIGSFGRKLLFAIRFNRFNLLLNDYIKEDSKILYHRNIAERASRIAPYIKFDSDPYLVIHEGRLFWVIDGFTRTDRYPYSTVLRENNPYGFGYADSYNYIRNSVKVVIDAYNGSTTFYSFRPEDDPLIRVYSKIFDGVFKPIDEMPQGLRSHLRYPQDLFDIQTNLFGTYHIEDPNVFFNKEDIWQVAEEVYSKNRQIMESYYAIMRLPGETREEFILLIPYTPREKPNMIAWFCARSDGDNYGRLLVYKFPKTRLVYGPMQVESRIDQTPGISEKLTLWNQQGSNVTRGNMIVIPIDNSLLYVEPLYLQAEQSRLPELKKVIVAYANSIHMEDNLELGLARIFGRAAAVSASSTVSEVKRSTLPDDKATLDMRPLRNLARSAIDHYNQAQDAVRRGDWAKYGEMMERVKQDLDRLLESSGEQ